MSKPYVTCTATSHQTGERCKNRPCPGRTTCRFHGGKTPEGEANPNFKHGRHSRVMPLKLAAMFEEALTDPDLTHFRNEIAYLDALLVNAISDMDPERRELEYFNARQAYADLKEAKETQNRALGEDAWIRLGAALDGYSAYDGAELKARRLIEEITKVKQAENARIAQSAATLSAQQGTAFVVAIVQVIRENVTDRDTLIAIQTGLSRLLGRPAPAGALPA